MPTRRPLTELLAILIGTLLSGSMLISDASAGCFDSLYGRPPAYSANYAYVPQSVYVAPPATTVAPAPASTGVIQAQRPAYGAPTYTYGSVAPVQTYENPSVYTGPVMQLPPQPTMAQPMVSAQRVPIGTTLPTTTSPTVINAPPVSSPATGMALVTPMPSTQSQSSYRLPITSSQIPTSSVPIASTLRGTATVNPIVPSMPYTANYPSTVAPVTYATNPAVTQPIVVQRAPVTSTQALPLAAPQEKGCCGLSRFFSSCWGSNTSYVTSYYRAPITYYRPMTTVNPVTGTTVTVQQPCSSYVQQMQRVPGNTILSSPAPVVNAPPMTGSCPTPSLAGPTVPSYPQSSSPATIMPPSGVGTVGGQSYPGGYSGVAPIPSTIPPSGYNGPSISNGGPPAPLSGSDPQDTQNVPQPRLEAARPDTAGSDVAGQEAASQPDASQNNPPQNQPRAQEQAPADSQQGSSSQDDSSAIQLDPPVTRLDSGNASGQSYATSTPPSLAAPPSASASQSFSTLRPIGVPADNNAAGTAGADSGISQPLPNAPAPQAPVTTPSPGFNNLPPLPVPSSQNADPSALFRDNETSSAGHRSSPTSDSRIREATIRQPSIRQVASWDDVEADEQVAPSTPQPEPIKRQFGGWVPVR